MHLLRVGRGAAPRAAFYSGYLHVVHARGEAHGRREASWQPGEVARLVLGDYG